MGRRRRGRCPSGSDGASGPSPPILGGGSRGPRRGGRGGGCGEAARGLSERLERCIETKPADLEEVLARTASVAAVVCLWEAATGETPPDTASRVATEGLAVVQTLLRRPPAPVWWVTSAAVAVH